MMASLVREFLQPLSVELEGVLTDTGERRVRVVRGWEAQAWDVPEAAALRQAGAGWDWVALAIPPFSFWDLHVGVLPAAHDDRPTIGLHWRPVLDDLVRPVALGMGPAGAVHHAELSGEFQQALPAPHTTPSETARAALDLALHVAESTAGEARDLLQAAPSTHRREPQ